MPTYAAGTDVSSDKSRTEGGLDGGAMSHTIRYMVGRGWAERVQDTTALPHRILTIGEYGDVDVRLHRPTGEEKTILQISGAELRLLAREARRAAARRFWARFGIR